MTLPIVRSARLTFWSLLLLVWGGLAIFWTWRILSDAGGDGLHIGSLALAIGSAFLPFITSMQRAVVSGLRWRCFSSERRS